MLSGTGVRFSRGLVLLWLGPAVVALVAMLVTQRARPDVRIRVKHAAGLLIVAYALGVIAITLYPYTFDFETGRILDRGNWIPFGGTLGFVTSDNSLQVEIGSRDFLANIVLFAPVGLLLGSRARRAGEVILVGLLLILMAFALEVIQGLTVAQRTLDIDDAIAGSIGATVAVAIGGLLPLGEPAPKTAH